MRRTSKAPAQGLTIRAFAGTTGVLIAFDVTDAARTGLLGFAIRREEAGGRSRWLNGMLRFEGQAAPAGAPVETRLAPIQKFRWSDYTVWPGRRYTYTVHPVYGTADALDIRDGATVQVSTGSLDRGRHRVVFNRAAAASQAFSRKFPEVEDELRLARKEKREPVLPPEVLDWLSRGVLEQITAFADRALDASWALDVAIYEYELDAIVEAVAAAVARGARVRLLYHDKTGDPQSEHNREAAHRFPVTSVGRRTSAIFHHKFMVLSRCDATGEVRTPVAVLGGSTNFTENGVYRQANVVHEAHDTDLASTYLALFDELWRLPTNRAATRRWIEANNSLPPTFPSQGAWFSPRGGLADIAAIEEAIGKASHDVLFCTAFSLHDRVLDALLGQPEDRILRLGVQNSRSRLTGYHRDRTALFTVKAMLGSGLEGFLAESTAGQRGNILIHTKLVVVDFTSDHPLVISGSHNLSKAASEKNDENVLVLRDPGVADTYGIELMRIYDHYRYRYSARPGRPPRLTLDDSWTERYFAPDSLHALDRQRFAGTA